MSSIIQVTNRDQGYARLGPENDAYIRGIASAIEPMIQTPTLPSSGMYTRCIEWATCSRLHFPSHGSAARTSSKILPMGSARA